MHEIFDIFEIHFDAMIFCTLQVGKENVRTALSCVRFDQKLTPAMEYTFGNTFICANMDVAKKVTFNPRIGRRCVTLEGEVFEPSGTLSGGMFLCIE